MSTPTGGPAAVAGGTPTVTKANTYAVWSKLTNIPIVTLWRRDHGKPSKKDKAARQQYLTPQEEKALKEYLIRSHVGP